MSAATVGGLTEVEARSVRAGDNDRTRFDETALAQLAESIRANGLAQPITVRPVGDEFEIVAGERRFRAMMLLGWERVPAIVRDLDDRSASDVMLVENTSRADLDLIDEAHAYAKRMAEGLSADEVAKVAGVSVIRVRFRVKLLELVDEAQALVRRGDLALGAVTPLHGLDANRQRMALRALARRDLTTQAFADLCGRLMADQNAEAQEGFDFDLAVEEVAGKSEASKRRASRSDLLAMVAALAAGTTDPDLKARAAQVLDLG